MTDSTTPTLALAAEADARLARLVDSLDELAERMTVNNLMQEGWEYTRGEAARVAHDSLQWARENRAMAMGGALAMAGAVAAICVIQSRRRKQAPPVPLYEAYAMEDPSIMNEYEDKSRAWDRVRDEASHLGARAGETYYSARSKAALLRESAGERAGEAAEAAYIAAERAREKVVQARDWASRQSEAHPWGVLVAGAALGVAVAALTSKRSGRKSAAVGANTPMKEAVSGARRAYDNAVERLDKAGFNADTARNELRQAADASRQKLDQVRNALADRLHTKN
ncbi:MAG: hypothetical protein WCZ66_06530 [Sphingomonadaceae bacterium]